MRISHTQSRMHPLGGCPVLGPGSNAHKYAQNTCQTHCQACISLKKSATVSPGRVLPLRPSCHFLSCAMHATPRLETNLPSWSNASALRSFCRALLGIAVRDIFALYRGRASCCDVGVRVDRVKADVQVCFEGLMVCIAGPCGGVQALLQPCALISVNVLGLKFRGEHSRLLRLYLSTNCNSWCGGCSRRRASGSQVGCQETSTTNLAGPNPSCEKSRVLNAL